VNTKLDYKIFFIASMCFIEYYSKDLKATAAKKI